MDSGSRALVAIRYAGMLLLEADSALGFALLPAEGVPVEDAPAAGGETVLRDQMPEAGPLLRGDGGHRPLRLATFAVVERVERRELVEGECPVCRGVLDPVERERGVIVCDACDQRLERHLRAWLEFAAIRDG